MSFISEEKSQVISVVTRSDLSLFIRHGLLLPVLVNLTRTLRQDFGKLEHTIAFIRPIFVRSLGDKVLHGGRQVNLPQRGLCKSHFGTTSNARTMRSCSASNGIV